MKQRSLLPYPLLALALVTLLGALWGGLVRIGWSWPVLNPALLAAHGPLMVSGFLGTLIGLERAIALGRRWAFGVPLLTLAGAGVLLVRADGAGPLLMTAGSLSLVAVMLALLRRQVVLFMIVMLAGTLAWLIGNALWLAGRAFAEVALWWMAFLLLTIAGERLELSRVLRLTPWRHGSFLAAIGLLLAGPSLALTSIEAGTRLMGVAMLGLAFWLARYDLARRTARQTGLTRFMAVCLLAGYAWLGVGGALALVSGGGVAGPLYDAILHAVFVGFVFSMIFGHAPVIFPAILRTPVAYHPAFYTHVALLHLSLLIRVAGDLADVSPIRRAGGLLNALAILLFLANTMRQARAARRPQTQAPVERRAIARARG